ncbi:MAG: pyridoxamine 5'-phosphate oxidase [Ignavibacteriales bacterium]|nr:pyridoxamine 5'-phosphate oxidase [Ignavibacteriales bacterium]
MLTRENLEQLRTEYMRRGLTETDVSPNPFAQFRTWFEDLLYTEPTEPTAMTLATSTKSGSVSVRTVLMKGFDEKGFIFFSNYDSRKGKELTENPQAALLFYWMDLGRQVRIEGRVEKLSREESKRYFHSRPRESQIGAWTSQQSSVIASRKILEEEYTQMQNKFAGKEIPLPPFWGGFSLAPLQFEFWQARPNRLHDRILFTKKNDSWKTERLAP